MSLRTSAGDDEHLETNRRAWDAMAARGEPLAQPASDSEIANPLKQVDPIGWLGSSIEGWKVLCLAAGGGRHSALYAAAGADVTVVDLSPGMLDLDRQVARDRSLSIRIVQASMENMPMLAQGEFDLVIHPVSTCYVPSLTPVFAEVRRVLRSSGLYISQHKQPTSLQTSVGRGPGGSYELTHHYYRDQPIPPVQDSNSVSRRLRESGATEYLHRWEQIVGGICRAGFVIEDLVEPVHAKDHAEPNSFADRARFVAPYVRIKARRRGGLPGLNDEANCGKSLWLPQ